MNPACVTAMAAALASGSFESCGRVYSTSVESFLFALGTAAALPGTLLAASRASALSSTRGKCILTQYKPDPGSSWQESPAATVGDIYGAVAPIDLNEILLRRIRTMLHQNIMSVILHVFG